jgi:hypothetical protein
MNKILNNEQRAASILFDHLKKNNFQSRNYDTMVNSDHNMLMADVTLFHDPSQPTLTEIYVRHIGFFDRNEDMELSIDHEVFVDTIKSMIHEYSIN